MSDTYWFGDVSRISPEAPVPIVKIDHEETRPGAAANVARNARAMGAEVTLCCVLGRDEGGDTVRQIIELEGIQNAIVTGGKTIRKLRVIGRQQQVVRVDFDEPVDDDSRALLDVTFRGTVQDCDIVVFSDYGKGALADIQVLIQVAKRAGKLVLIDPKGYDYKKYAGADLVKPNQDEMRALVGGWTSEAVLGEKVARLRDETGLAKILMTRASDGMSLFTETGATHYKAAAAEVYDVTGAGDTAIAALAVGLGRRMSLDGAVYHANLAAGIAVGRFGTAVVTGKEVFGGQTRDEEARSWQNQLA